MLGSSPRSLVLFLALASCSTGRSVVGGPADAGDLPDLADVSAPLDAMDVAVVPDVPIAADVPIDVPDAPAEVFVFRCTVDKDCIGTGAGLACDVASGRCVPCTATSDRCPSGQYCVAALNRCDNGCRDDDACSSSGSRSHCDPSVHACVACLTDDHCPAGNLCVGNVCVMGCNAASRCPDGQSCCSGACVDTQANTANCGRCDNQCALENANAVCRNAACAVMGCTLPFGDCDTLAANGCETDITRSVAHCGTCGRPCEVRAQGTATCTDSTCSYAPMEGFADCDNATSTGYETDTRVSPDHCGNCMTRCSLAGATAGCVGGQCTVASCSAGRADCNRVASDGCESIRASDPLNCGGCDTVCPEVGGQRSCFAGQCSAPSCAAILALVPTAPSGPYILDLDGTGPGVARSYYCDMREGGWTVVANQVPAELLADSNATLGETVFGDITHSWRLGNPEITRVNPTVAWRLSDDVTNVYVARGCVVDWTHEYINDVSATECTTGYTTAALNVVVNGRWTNCSARGIGINYTGANCSIRMNEGGFGRGVGALANGRAYSCDYTTSRRVSLAFR